MLDGIKHIASGSKLCMINIMHRLSDSLECDRELDHCYSSCVHLSVYSVQGVDDPSADPVLQDAEQVFYRGEERNVTCL